MRYKKVSEFNIGLYDSIEDISIPDGAASAALNWRHRPDRLELSFGYIAMGPEIPGVGRVSGLHVAYKADGTQILYRKRGRKLEYYQPGTQAWEEVGTDIFPEDAADDDMTFSNYSSLAGNQVFFSSPNSSFYKIMAANPGDYADIYDSAKNFKGYLKVKQNRTFLWHRNEDRTGIYGSYIDAQEYTSVAAESVGVGDGTTVTYSGTLTFKAGSAKRTAFGLAIKIDGAATLTDDFSGNLRDSGGVVRGSINYMTGAYSVTFANPPPAAAAITVDYQWEDSTNKGIADFTKDSPDRKAGQGFIFRQDDGGGGDSQSVESYGDVEYCLHRNKTWALTITADDTDATNLIFRDRVGIPNPRAAVATGDGIYYVDDLNETDPKFRLLTTQPASEAIIPFSVSDNLRLSDYRFDQAASQEWGDYILFACRHKDSPVNNIVFAYNKRFKLWDRLDYNVSCFITFNGALAAGDSLSYNAYELFSGFDANNDTINNFWESNLSTLEIEQLKKTRRYWVEGEISRDQQLLIYLSFDNGPFVLVGTQNGTDSNVDIEGRTLIGSDVIGEETIGGGTSTTVYHYIKEIRLKADKFYKVKRRFVATKIGYCSITSYTDYDILLYVTKLPQKYRAIP